MDIHIVVNLRKEVYKLCLCLSVFDTAEKLKQFSMKKKNYTENLIY